MFFSFSWEVHISQVKKGRTTTEAGNKAREVLDEVILPGTDRRYTEGGVKRGNIKKHQGSVAVRNY